MTEWARTFQGSEMDQGPNIHRVAEDMVRSLGSRAFSYLCEQAELAKLSGDRESAITWWDIALAVVEIRNARGLVSLAFLIGGCLT